MVGLPGGGVALPPVTASVADVSMVSDVGTGSGGGKGKHVSVPPYSVKQTESVVLAVADEAVEDGPVTASLLDVVCPAVGDVL